MKLGEVRDAERERHGKPLAGVRVLALEQMQALPYATQLLSHLGADIIKVEPPGRGDSGRASRPLVTDRDGTQVGATFVRNNLNKRSITIDLKSNAGQDLVKRLVPHFDIVAENFRGGALTKMGLGYEDLAAVDGRIIYLSISGFGNLKDTPYASWPAYAPIAEAMAGLYEPTRRPGEPPPVVVAGALGDNASALFAIIGTLAALRQRDQTGEGQYVDISMYNSMVGLTDMVPFMWSVGEPPSAATAGRTGIVSAFAASDGYFVLAIFREHQFERLAALTGHPEWCDDPRFATREGWAEHREAVVRPALEAWARDKTKLEAARALCAEGIAAGPSNLAADICADPHIQNHNMLIEVPRADTGETMLIVGNPVKTSRLADGPVRPFPTLGEHTDEVFRETLGMSDAELEALRAEGVI